ncbi:F0F1 ATP synthase subunit A [Aggregatilineales bacterium SYSU G02658]
MSASQRGCLGLLGFLAFAFFACILIPFILLPGVGQAVTLPVITVPAEYYLKHWPSADFEIRNSLGGAVLAMVIVFAIALIARRHSNGWTKEVPGRFQGAVEVIIDGLWGLTKQQAGDKPRVRNLLFPLVASLFLFLLAANLGKLLPGVETIGVVHCAVYEPQPLNGFPVHETSFLGRPYFVYRSETPLNIGTPATEKSYKQCQAMFGVQRYQDYLPRRLDPFLDKQVTYTVQQGDTLASIAARFNDEITARTESDPIQVSSYVQVPYEGWAELTITPADIVAANTVNGVVNIQFEAAAAGEEHGEGEAHSRLPVVEVAPQQAEGEPAPVEAEAEPAPAEAEPAPAEAAPGVNATAALVPGQTIVIRPELLGEKATTLHNQIFTVAPFVRGVTTDLSFTIGLALLSFVVIQYFGVSELGLSYFQKFINIGAIGNIGKRPLGAVDFIVGLFEIISELGKIVSLSFRLFGALFAGTVLFAVILFLVGTTIPAIILLLEIIIGVAQAAVFSILTLIFSAQAMVSHHHDDEEHGHGEAAAAHH